MATPLQTAANKANAQKSTGPRTDQGKAASSLNRLSHGFASSATIIPGEDPEEFRALVDDLMLQHQPANPTEQILLEQMAINQWLILRAFRLQGYAFLGQSMQDDKFATPKDLGLLIRYQTSAERGFQRSYSQLVKTQKERRKSEIGFEPQNTSESTELPAAPPPAQPKTESVKTDPPAKPAASAPPVTQPDTEIVPKGLDRQNVSNASVKNAA